MDEAVVPTEDVVQALLDYLVEPLLPSRTSSVTDHYPTLPQQQSMAKQMHAVVLLYNYYHRKQYPLLEFLDFESFCKVSVNAKPTLLVYMNLMQKCSSESNDLEKLLSLTEKAIMNACKICLALDASRDSPCIEGWPISKVVIFLTDSIMKNCSLQFGSETKGVWSPIEKDIDCSTDKFEDKLITRNVYKKQKTTKRSFKDELRINEANLKQLAFSAVKETTGIDHMDLLVMESHVVPSLTTEKKAAYFCILQCTKSIDENVVRVPIGDALNSLQGPLVKKIFENTASEVVEYFHLLPYATILSDWFSRAGKENVLIEDSTTAIRSCSLEVDKTNDSAYETCGTPDFIDYETIYTTTINQEENVGCVPNHLKESCTAKDDLNVVSLPNYVKSTPTPNMAAVDHEGKETRSSTEDDLSSAKAESVHKVDKADLVLEEHNSGLAAGKTAYGNDITDAVDHANKSMRSTTEDDQSTAKAESKVNRADLVMEKHNNRLEAEKTAYGNHIMDAVDHVNTLMRSSTEDDQSNAKAVSKVNKADLVMEKHKNRLAAEKTAYGNDIMVAVDHVNTSMRSSTEGDQSIAKAVSKVNKTASMIEEHNDVLAAEKSAYGNDIMVAVDQVNRSTGSSVADDARNAKDGSKHKVNKAALMIGEHSNELAAQKSAYGNDITIAVDQVNRSMRSSVEDDPSNAKDGSKYKVKKAGLMIEDHNKRLAAGKSAYGNDIMVPVDHVNRTTRSSTEGGPSDAKAKSNDKVNKADLMIEEHSKGLGAEKSSYGNYITAAVDHVNRMARSSTEDNRSNGKSESAYKVNKAVIEEQSSGHAAEKSVYGDDNCNIDLSGQEGMPSGDHHLVQFQSVSQNLDSTQTILASKGNELLEAASRLLYKKRDELSQQQRNLQDEVALCEKNLQTILSGGDDLMLNLQCVIEACNIACYTRCIPSHMETYQKFGMLGSPQNRKRKRLSEAVLTLQNPCQELDDICCKNNWPLPSYSVLPSNGEFHANVMLQGMDFELSGAGDARSDPREARESAAAQMLIKLRSMASQSKAK